MKKFVFTMATLLRIKESLKKQQQAELGRIIVELNRLYDEKQALIQAFEREADEYDRAARAGAHVERMNQFARYFPVLHERRKAVDAQIAEKEAEKADCQQRLVKTMQEQKMLEKLREKQYEQYLVEVAQDQDKQIGDFVNYQIISS